MIEKKPYKYLEDKFVTIFTDSGKIIMRVGHVEGDQIKGKCFFIEDELMIEGRVFEIEDTDVVKDCRMSSEPEITLFRKCEEYKKVLSHVTSKKKASHMKPKGNYID
jgi:hypothetical protein